MNRVILIFALFLCMDLSAQKPMPGGVKGAALWEIKEVTQPGQAMWAEAKKTNSTLNLGSLASFSMFTVCQGVDTLRERVILSLENDTAAELVLTNRRLALLDVYQYANYNTNLQLYPKIYTYVQNKPVEKGTVTRRLQMGRQPYGQRLPVSDFNGIMPEIILFERVISQMERRKVESYLALKYGISLNQQLPVSYLNSNEEVIWDAEKNAAFNQNIAGIGRDDLSGLDQGTSESSLNPGAMKISINGELQNNSFLIWGDNGLPLCFTERQGIRKLQKDWKISPFNLKSGYVCLETNELSLKEIKPLNEGETYWMMADRSGTGKYPFGKTEYISCLPVSSTEGFIRFGSVLIDADNSGADVFTILAAPSFFSRSTAHAPSCVQPQTGTIMSEIAGGMPPFGLLLKGISNERFQVSATERSRNHVFENIDQGAYTLQVTDADKKIYTEKIFVSNSHNWESSMSGSYDLVQGETLVLDASEGMPGSNYIYSWTMPDGSVLNQQEISINQAGIYFFSVTDDDNCNSIHEINVRETGKSVFRGVEMFPNPARGWFVIRISLDRITDVNVIISDTSGRILKQTMLQNDNFYLYNEILQKPGVYIITLVSSNEQESLKLIVQ